MKELDKHPTLKGKFSREQWKVRAAAPHNHCGYQKWHREIDEKIIKWLKDDENRDATPEEFIAFLRSLYSRRDMIVRFPDALEVIK